MTNSCYCLCFKLSKFDFSDIDQLLKIMKLCGTPDDEFMSRITSQEARNYIRTLPLMQKKDFKAEFRNANDQAVSLLEKMLELDYEKRYDKMMSCYQ